AGADGRPVWQGGGVPAEHAVRGFEGVTLTEWNPEVTLKVLTGTMGFRQVAEERDRIRLETGSGGHGARVDVLAAPTAPRGHISAGTVHHVAWRAADEQDQLAWREAVAEADGRPVWQGGGVPAEHAVRGFEGVTLTEWNPEVTVRVLADTMGFRKVAEEGDRIRLETGSGGHGARVDILASPTAPRGHISAGTVHHVAWRAADEADQIAWREAVAGAGLSVTPVLDRQYFRSIYFREPGGVLFEIATDPPGFTLDEPVASLGSGLKLPPWLEKNRERIEAVLPPIEVREAATAGGAS
ncbi:MAG TPA: VOC family protein, partial [Thermoanaerobaculia bacterium]|nr:VOC family protein [Thermoanaerobaculia bacterium]